MVEFTRCPKCTTLYELDGVDLSGSNGWVQCGECDRKFKAASHAVEPDELSFTVSNYSRDESMKMAGSVSEKDVESSMQVINQPDTEEPQQSSRYIPSYTSQSEPISQDLERQQLSQQLQDRDSEFMEKTIILPDDLSEDEDFEDVFNNFSEDIFSPDLIDEDEPEDHLRKRRTNNTYAELHSEFSEEEIVVEPDFSEKTLLEEELETNTANPLTETTEPVSQVEYKTYDVDSSSGFTAFIPAAACFLVTLGLVALLALQVHSRGTYQWIPQKYYDGLISRVPYLAKLEKTQTDLSAIHLASTRMEVNPSDPNARIITLQLVNQSYSNQAYPDFQLEFTDAKGDTIARRVVLPNLYLEKDHLGLLESREAKIVLLNLKSLPIGAVGYQIKVVQQRS